MAAKNTHVPGKFCWVELNTNDVQKAKKYYGELLGWSFRDNDMGGGMTYSIIQKNNEPVAGLFASDEVTKGQIPPHWNNYVCVESAEKAVNQAKALGAIIIEDPMDVSEFGRMAVIQDPTGAIFSVWQNKNHTGATASAQEPGGWCWNELGTPDLAKAEKFYTELFGWKTRCNDPSPMKYTEFSLADGRSIGGMYQITKDMPDVPAHWLCYFTVDNIETRTAQAKKMGAQAYTENNSAGGVGRFSIIEDPQGGVAGFIQLEKKW